MDEKQKKALTGILVSSGLLSKKQMEAVLAKEEVFRARIIKARGMSAKKGRQRPEVSLLEIIESLKLKVPGNDALLITEEVIMKEVARQLKLPFLKIDPLKLDSNVVTMLISRPYAVKYLLVPVDIKGNRLTVAVANPFEQEGIDGIRQSKGYEVDLVVSTRPDIMKIITEFYGFRYSITAAHNELASGIDLGNLEQYVKLKSFAELGGTDQHIINAVEYLLHYAYSQRASDIHIEPKREHSLVRFRIDGILHGIFEIMEITERIRTAIEEKTSPTKLKQLARAEGMMTLRENAIAILLKGETTVDEVVRVTGISS